MLQFPKPQRGTHVLDRETARYAIVKAERLAKALAKRRDHWGCRWPEVHRCRGPIEVAHIFEDKKMGGDHGRLSHSAALMTLCAWIHRLGPASIHGKQLRVEPETEFGADAACAFYRLDEHGIWVGVGVEVRIGVLRKL